MTPFTTTLVIVTALRLAAIAVIVMTATTLAAREASAYSTTVKLACATDYFTHCSQYSLSSPSVNKCMNAVGPRLAPRCINALVAAGEVSRAEADRRLAAAK